MKLKITTTTLTDLITSKRKNPQDFTIDDKLEIFSNLEPIKSHRNYATYIKGIFKSNRTPLSTYVDNHCCSETKPISEGILNQFIKLTKHRDIYTRQIGINFQGVFDTSFTICIYCEK